LLAKKPDLSPAGVAKTLEDAAAKLPAMAKKKRTGEFGSGFLDLVAALS
jgi:hypothetical protein